MKYGSSGNAAEREAWMRQRQRERVAEVKGQREAQLLAERYGVSRMTIYRWKTFLSNGEDGLKARKSPTKARS